MSTSNITTLATNTDDAYLDAAREAILAVGVKRTTLTDVARRAGISRMTLYRRWPDMRALLGDLMTREWLSVAAGILNGENAPASPTHISSAIVEVTHTLRDNLLFAKITAVDPEFLLPYLLQRRGRTQDALLGIIERAVVSGQQQGTVRHGDATLFARSILLAAHGHAISAHTMTGDITLAEIDTEFTHMITGYLAS